MARAKRRLGQHFLTDRRILERIADGRFVLGYNILGSYAADWASRDPEVGIVLPRDYTVVMSRIGLVPAAARAPDLHFDGRRMVFAGRRAADGPSRCP